MRSRLAFVLCVLSILSVLLPAAAAPVYVNPTDTLVPNDPAQAIWLDLDNSGGAGNIIVNDGTVIPDGADLLFTFEGPEDVIYTGGDTGSFPYGNTTTGAMARLAAGQAVPALGAGLNDTFFGGTSYLETVGFPSPWDGSSGTAFLGFAKASIDPGTGAVGPGHSGWLRVTYNDATNSLTILDWAYESATETPINAGAGLPAPLSGTKTVGPTGDYASITAAIADVNAVGKGLGGALVLELQAAYVSSVETFPLTIPALNGASATNTLTIRPATGATALSISSTTTTTVDLNGAQFVTFDGRPGGVGSNAGSGVGTASQLTIENTSTGGVALRFINEASNNTLRYTTLRGVNTSATGGTIIFGTTTGANGNDNNTLDRCDLGNTGTFVTNVLYASGSLDTPEQANSGNTVSNCNVINFYSSAANAAGVLLGAGNTGWTISANSFYWTATRSAVARTLNPILINNTSGDNFTVTGNFIGGTEPSAGGSAWTVTGTTAAFVFQGIRLNVGTTTPSSVQGNTIKNVVWNTSASLASLPGIWSGIHVEAGSANIGTVTGNTIGSGTGTGSISITTSGGGTSFGISSTSSGTVAIANNTIGSITTFGTSNTVSASLNGISVTAGTSTISNNTVGSTTTANSLNAATSSTSSSGQQVTGIASIPASIMGNTVANLNNNYSGTGTAGQIRGIFIFSGLTTTTIIGNTVRNLSTTSRNTNSTNQQSVYGIFVNGASSGLTVSQNTVHSLANTSTLGVAVSVTGIYFAGSGSRTNVVARNFVHSLAVSSSSASSVLNGMQFGDGSFTAQNNIVRVGVDASGASTAGASTVRGIYDNGTSSGRNFYHNSVYVGGTQTSGSASTFAFSSSFGTNARTFQNNLFVNARSNSGATSKHYAVAYGGTTVNPTGLTAGGNLFLANGTGGVLGLYNSVDRTTLADWQAATGQDATSAVADPLFVAPTGTASTVDLHLQTSNPAERGGIALTDALTGATVTVTDDFDGQTRSTLTPVDVGADAGNFTLTSDLFAPGISYPLLTSGSTASRVLTGWATITDNSGSVSGSANAPRLYYKKSTDADVFGGNTAADNGWKYVTATGSGPAYSFTMDYSLINGGSVIAGDTVQYFVVAQDDANNLGSRPAAATASANPPVQNLSAKPGAGVNSFSIVGTLSGTKTVGTGGDYPSLSGAGGLFAALNASVLTGNVVVNITSDTTEDGGVTLNEFLTNESPASITYTLTIQPDSATMRTISGSGASGLIRFNGADRVTIDGRFGGSGRYLTFRNTSTGTTSSTLLFINDSSNNTVRNCVVEGATTSTTLGVIGFSTGTVTGNDNNLITDCQVRDLSTAAGVPAILIGSTGSSAAGGNSGNTVSNNELFNFVTYGISIAPTGNDSWTLSGNTIYQMVAQTSAMNGISFGGSGTITGNTIHDLNTNQYAAGIYLNSGTSVTVSRNRIYSFPSASGSTALLQGIYNLGFTTVTVVNNQISIIPSFTNTQSIEGIRDDVGNGGVFNAYYNSVVIGGTASGSSSWAAIRKGADSFAARNNLFLNLRTGGSGSHFAAGSEVTGGSFTVSNNVYAGTGATAANFMDFSATPGTAVPVSFAAWQTSTGDTSPSASNPGGDYSSAMFVSPSTGDLHLVPGGNVLVNGAGTPIAGVTTDYDGDLRSLTTPTIGADEIVLAVPDIAVTQTSAVADGGSIDFGNVTLGSSSAAKTFTITNPGTADLTSLVITGGTSEFTVTALSGTSIPVGSGSVTFSVTFTPSASGPRTTTLQIASNVTGTKNPYDIVLNGTGQTLFQAWATANSATANATTLPNFAFGTAPGVSTALVYTGTFAGGGAITATGTPITAVEPTTNGVDFRALFVRRKDYVAAGLTYTPQFSANLTTWADSTEVPTVLADDGVNQIVSVPYPPFVGGKKARFFQVSVSLAP